MNRVELDIGKDGVAVLRLESPNGRNSLGHCGHRPFHRARGSGGRGRLRPGAGPCRRRELLGGHGFRRPDARSPGPRRRTAGVPVSRGPKDLVRQDPGLEHSDHRRGSRFVRGVGLGVSRGRGLHDHRCDHADPGPGGEGRSRPRKRGHLVSAEAHGPRGGQVLRSDRLPHGRKTGGGSGSGPGVRGRRRRWLSRRAPAGEGRSGSPADLRSPGKEGGHARGPCGGGSRTCGEDRPALRVRAGQPGVPGGHLLRPGASRGGRETSSRGNPWPRCDRPRPRRCG